MLFSTAVESRGGEGTMGADFTRAILKNTDLRGTDLRTAIGLTVQQIKQAITDDNTKFPDYLIRALARADEAERPRLPARW
ncbi:MAG: pentapeptide repeat-containing protein [Pirellulales bacterium]